MTSVRGIREPALRDDLADRYAPAREKGLYAEVKSGGRFSRATIRAGEQYGDLTPVRIIERLGDGSHVWACRCSCGRTVKRTVGSLNLALRRGHVPACRRCSADMRRWSTKDRALKHKEAWLGLWRVHHTLWSESAVARLLEQVRTDLAQEFGTSEESYASAADDTLMWSPRLERTEQRRGDLRRIRQRRANMYWACVHCSCMFRIGWGCIECIEPVCVQCVADGAHKHRADSTASFAEIGREYGVCRERARQILTGALRSFARAWQATVETASTHITVVDGTMAQLKADTRAGNWTGAHAGAADDRRAIEAATVRWLRIAPQQEVEDALATAATTAHVRDLASRVARAYRDGSLLQLRAQPGVGPATRGLLREAFWNAVVVPELLRAGAHETRGRAA